MVDPKRGVFHVAGLFTKDGAQQFFFGRQRGLSLGGDLADQRVTGLYFSTHKNDAGFIKPVELLFAQVGDVAGDFLGTELGIAGHHHQLFNMYRGVAVFGDHALADEDGVFEVVAIPGHECNQHVLAQGQFTEVG